MGRAEQRRVCVEPSARRTGIEGADVRQYAQLTQVDSADCRRPVILRSFIAVAAVINVNHQNDQACVLKVANNAITSDAISPQT